MTTVKRFGNMTHAEITACKERANGLTIEEQQVFATQFPTAVLWNEIEGRIKNYQDLENELQDLKKRFL